MVDWLFQWPQSEIGTAGAQLSILKNWLKSDPVAQTISDDEAEEFIALAEMLLVIRYPELDGLCRKLGEGFVRNTEADKRRAVLTVLRCWRNPKQREFLSEARQYIGFGNLGSIEKCEHTMTLQRLVNAYQDDHLPLVWVTSILKLTGRAADVMPVLDALGTGALLKYHTALLNGRAMMRRILDGVSQPWCTPNSQPGRPEEDEERLARRLREKESALNTLTGDIKAGERSRGDWKRAVRRTALDVEAQLQRARAEVAAAAEEIDRRRSAHRREMDALVAQCGRRLEHLQERLASERRQFAEALAERAARSGAAPLLGWSVSVSGADAEPETYRLLVESAGGRLVAEGADLAITLGGSDSRESAFRAEGTGLAAFERTLCRQVIPWVLRHRMGRQ